MSSGTRLDSLGAAVAMCARELLDFTVGQGFQLFDDLLQSAAALGVILLCGQSASLLGVLLVQSLDVADLFLQQVDTAQDCFSSV
jgi:hypothetical protein